MEKVLNQEEIDAMMRAARGGGEGGGEDGAVAPVAQPWDAREAGLLGREQVRTIRQLHEVFARNLIHSLGAYLRVALAANLVSAENLAYREFLGRLPEITYLAAFHLLPQGGVAVLQMDHAIAFPIIDLLLGGEGTGKSPERAITEIEESILESVSTIICRELEDAWRVLHLTFAFEQRLGHAQVQRLFPPEEKTLSLNFEITLQENRGSLTVAFPAVVSNALLRKLANESTSRQPRHTEESARRLRERLQLATFPVQLELAELAVPLQSVLGLKSGEILHLPLRSGTAAQLSVSGEPMFVAFPIRNDEARAAHISRSLRIVEETGKEAGRVGESLSSAAGV